ncbi:MAG: endonuclease III domain-containing protein [Candidatus Muiribacteriota bacterium]
MKNNNKIDSIITILKKETKYFKIPSVTMLSKLNISPFHILISTLLSLRTRDETTLEVSEKLFRVAQNPDELLDIPDNKLEKIIYKTGFYRNKAKTLKHVCRELNTRFSGRVPDTLQNLLSIKGIGRKTANLVLIKGFNKYGICVDTHVHRICNRIGLVKTKNADKTELELRKILPEKYWKEINDLMVKYGQNICKPVNPICKECRIIECNYNKSK